MSANLIGKTLLNQFRIDAFVASGGMGVVYRVWDIQRNVPLAMKVLHADLAEDPSILKRFKREANALKKLGHPNIVPFYGLHQTDDFSFLLEQYVDGPTLKDILRRRKSQPMPVQEVLIYLKALSAALGYAHVHGVVHCDVKPGNVMVDYGGNIYLTDFGIARHAESTTTTLGVAGTPAYMAPEQIRGEAVTPATDVYALGVLLFEMLTGQRTFRGTESGTESSGATAAERIRYAHLHLLPPDPRSLNSAIPETLALVVLNALAKVPKDRYQSTRQLYASACAAAGMDAEVVADRVVSPGISPDPTSLEQVQFPERNIPSQLHSPPEEGKWRATPWLASSKKTFIIGGSVMILLMFFLLFGKILSGGLGITTPTPVVASIVSDKALVEQYGTLPPLTLADIPTITPTAVPPLDVNPSQHLSETPALALITVRVQDEIKFSTLKIDLWPEYDRPSVLVIYHITLPANTSLPVDLTLRIPASAGEPNALAVKQVDGGLFTVAYDRQVSGEWSLINFAATMPEIQVEYYDPGIVKQGTTRHFEYHWPGDYTVDSVSIQVQQPVGVTELHISPASNNRSKGPDGLMYYDKLVGSLAVGQTFSLKLDYLKSSDSLSSESLNVHSSAPQGKIVYTCQVTGLVEQDQICLVNADGTGFRQMTTDNNTQNRFPSLAPDGNSIIFVSNRTGNYEIYELDLNGAVTQLTDKLGKLNAPEISPNGRFIVFTNKTGGNMIWVMNRDGSNPNQIFGLPQGYGWDPSWSPDGSQILFASGSAKKPNISIMNADGSNDRLVTNMDKLRGRSDWVPGGVTIATYVGDSWHREIILLDLDGSNQRKITNGGNNLAPSFSPDGEWITFTSYRDNYGDENGCEIYIMQTDGSDIRRLTNNGFCDYQPRWGP